VSNNKITEVVLLAGGYGTRISEESRVKPKPLINIGERPILWHIMKIYHEFGIKKFVICLGYKGYLIKEYFHNYMLHTSDVTIDCKENAIKYHNNRSEDWEITLVNTGLDTMTGGRIKRVKDYITGSNFFMTYGDGLSNVNIESLEKQHHDSGNLVTMTAVKPPGRFGAIDLEGNKIIGFREKPEGEVGWINGGFFVCNEKVFDIIENDSTVWEKEPLEHLSANSQLGAYFHSDFWQPMDTLREKNYLENLWNLNNAPWKIW